MYLNCVFEHDKIGEQIYRDFSKFGKRIDKKILTEIRTGFKNDDKQIDITNRIAREVRNGKRYANTWVNTSIGAIQKAERLERQINNGVEYFEYSGPNPKRDFCKFHIGRVYHYTEIEQMDNGQGLPVLYYGGGYNCRHWWKGSSKEEFEKRDKSFIAENESVKFDEDKIYNISKNTRKLVRHLNEVERKIKGQDYETGVLMDKEGSIVLSKDGSKNRVVFSVRQKKHMKGLILSHNHPNGLSLSQTGLVRLSHCIKCKHFNKKFEKDLEPTCSAFPKGIPKEFYEYGAFSKQHDKIDPDQVGEYVFEKRERVK
ncbi:MAG: hypothetical protein JXA68_12050 [Ignavibacteriales bacterium]|nr:hypothetical protein [Ignavibacteriales bacterium]